MRLNWTDVNERFPNDWEEWEDSELIVEGVSVPRMRQTYPVLATDGVDYFIDYVCQLAGGEPSFYLNKNITHWMDLPYLPAYLE
jgi:hypothetical protein